jgi:hypothetical protein
LVARRHVATRFFDAGRRRIGGRRDIVEAGRVGHDAVADAPAEELTDRPAGRLAHQVPERHFEPAQRLDGQPADPAGPVEGGLGLLPDPLDVERVLADGQRRQHVLDEQLAHARERPGAGLAPPDQPVVGADLD